MSTDNEFKDLLKAILQGKSPENTESRNLLCWFLYNAFRLDEMQSDEVVCDKSNDKGIDGVWADEDTNEVFLFSSVYTDRPEKTLGDKDLREFVGSAMWFSNPESLKELAKSIANPELKALVARQGLIEKLEAGWEVKLIFVTTKLIDTNSEDYKKAAAASEKPLEVWDRTRLIGHHKNLTRKTRVTGKARFSLATKGIEHKGKKDTRVFVAPIQAKEIAALEGISDRSLFLLNVRSGLGRTRVNKDLATALKEKSGHSEFLLFHNGVTIICRKFEPTEKEMVIEDYSVVNGCQSAVAFFENQIHLTSDLLVLARFIEVGDDDALAEDITYRSNNQNGINMRDLRSNDRIQLSLKHGFDKEFGGTFAYLIKAGEAPGGGESIKNDRAGQLIMALYLNEPYFTHQKDRIFATEYERVFNRSINAQKIFLAYLLESAIEFVMEKIEDPLVRSYQLTKFILLGSLGEILRHDPEGNKLISKPDLYLPTNRTAVFDAARVLVSHLLTDFNYYVKEKSAKEYYDYKSEFKNADKYQTLCAELLRQYDKSLVRHPEDSFAKVFGAELAKHHNPLN
jgi:hypothetical protein